MKKATLISAFLGTMIEVYDFTVFPLLIPILSEVFFYSSEKGRAINFILLAYAVSYIVKPLSTIGFGYLIDDFGRKRVLLFTTLLMTFATSAIGFFPAHIMGMYYGVGLIICRVIQGIAISGEFSSALIMVVEHGSKYPAFSGSFAFFGGSVGLLLSNLSIFTLLYLMPHEQIIQYAWRIPFLIGCFGCLLLLFIRNKIDSFYYNKTPKTSSFAKLFKSHKKELFLVFIVSSLSASAFYITFIFMPMLLSALLNLHSHQRSSLITLIGIFVYILFLPFAGLLADKIGVERQIKIAALLYLLFSYGIFTVITQMNNTYCICALILFVIVQALLNSALPVYMVTLFDLNQRGKALAISYNMSLTLFGGLMPYLIVTTKSQLNPGVPISMCAVLSLIFIHLKGKKHDYLRGELSY